MPGERINLIPTRRSLLKRLKNLDDQRSWQDFFDTYWRLIYSVARHAGLTEDEAQDVVQDTVLTVARHIPNFEYDPARGSFKGWLLKITRSRIVDQLRKRPPPAQEMGHAAHDSNETPTTERIPDPHSLELDTAWDREWEQSLVEAAMKKVRSRADPAQYQMFLLHVFRQLPANQVARKLGVRIGRVYFAKYKISRLIKQEIKRLEKKMV